MVQIRQFLGTKEGLIVIALELHFVTGQGHGEFGTLFVAHTSVHSRKVIYPDRNLVTLQNIAYIDDGNFVIATIIDVTREEKQAKQEYAKKKATIDLAQNVIYKQMMVAQNIAGLLGETTAETKTTLMKLCSLIDDESESEVR